MKKVISTILTLTMLATPLIGSACFAYEVKNDTDSYVQEQDRRDQYKLRQQKIGRVAKLAGCVAAGTAAVVGTAIAGLKLFEDSLPESVKEYLPNWLKKDDALKLKQISSPENEFDDKRMESDAGNEEECSANSYGAMEDVRDTAMPGNITKSESEIPDSDNQKKYPAKCYKNMEDARDTEMPGNITNSTSNANNSGNLPQPKQPQSGENNATTLLTLTVEATKTETIKATAPEVVETAEREFTEQGEGMWHTILEHRHIAEAISGTLTIVVLVLGMRGVL